MSTERLSRFQGPGFLAHPYNVGLTGVASAAPIATWRNNTGRNARVTRLQAYMLLTTAFAAAQRIGICLRLASAWTVDDSGGAAFNTDTCKQAGGAVPSGLTSRVGGPGALTPGTRTLATGELFGSFAWSAAVGTLVTLEFSPARECEYLNIPSPGGIVLQNMDNFGGAGVATFGLRVEYDFGP